MRRSPLLIGLLCLCLVIAGCAEHKRGNGSRNITYEITGVGVTGNIKIDYLAQMDQRGANQKIHSRRSNDYAAVPYTKEVTLGDFWDHAYIHGTYRGTQSHRVSLTCTIKHNGTVVATRTANQSVSCRAPMGAADESD